MTILNEEKPSLDDYLEHHGVKGQKWGVRRDAAGGALVTQAKRLNTNATEIHNERVNKQIGLNQRVASGNGSFREKAAVASTATLGGLVRRGVKGTAQKNADNLRAHQERLKTGNATARDVLIKYGANSPADVGRIALRGVKLGGKAGEVQQRTLQEQKRAKAKAEAYKIAGKLAVATVLSTYGLHKIDKAFNG